MFNPNVQSKLSGRFQAQMERSTFFRPSDDMDFMAPLSDVSDDEVFASAPRMAARSMALAAKKRGPVTCCDLSRLHVVVVIYIPPYFLK